MKRMLGWSTVLGVLVAVLVVHEAVAQGEGKGRKGEGRGPREKPVVDRFAQIDANGDGVISLDEFKAAHAKRMEGMKEKMGDKFDPARLEKKAEEMFTRMDKDNSGGITREEFAAALEQHKGNRERIQKQQGKEAAPADIPAAL